MTMFFVVATRGLPTRYEVWGRCPETRREWLVSAFEERHEAEEFIGGSHEQ